MKPSRVFCMVALVALVTVVAAGPAAAGPLGKGVKAGLSYSKLTNSADNIDDSDSMAGVAAGVFFNYQLAPGLKLQPELLYVQQGGKYDNTIVNDSGIPVGSGETRLKVSYLQVPVMARVSLPVVGALLPTLMAGPALSFKASSEIEQEVDGESAETADWDDVASTDLSVIVGLGFKVGAGPAGVTVDLRYVHGLTDINEDGTPDAPEMKNRSIQALAGFSF